MKKSTTYIIEQVSKNGRKKKEITVLPTNSYTAAESLIDEALDCSVQRLENHNPQRYEAENGNIYELRLVPCMEWGVKSNWRIKKQKGDLLF